MKYYAPTSIIEDYNHMEIPAGKVLVSVGCIGHGGQAILLQADRKDFDEGRLLRLAEVISYKVYESYGMPDDVMSFFVVPGDKGLVGDDNFIALANLLSQVVALSLSARMFKLIQDSKKEKAS